MNAQMFYAVMVFAVLALGFFAFLVGAKSSRARTQKEKGDEHGYHTTIEDFVKLTAASVIILAATILGIFLAALGAPHLLTVPGSWIGDPGGFLINVVGSIILAAAIGFYLGVCLQEKLDKKADSKSLKAFLPALTVVGAIGFLTSIVSASNTTEQMQPVTDILVWSGSDMAPAVIVLFLALVPLIMITIGVRFAGGMLASLLDGIREIFTFRF